MTLDVGTVWAAMLAFIRATALLALIPGIGGDSAPVRVRAALGLFFAIFMLPVLEPEYFPTHLFGLMYTAANEVLIGLMMGLAARMVFFAIELAGHVMSHEMGLMMSTSIDPLSGTNNSTLGTVLFYFTLLIFFVTGAYQEVFLAFARSFQLLPPGQSLLETGSIDNLIRGSSRVFVLATLISAPLIAINFVVLMTFAVLGKAVPKMNVFITSFSVRILMGFVILGSTISLIAHYIEAEVLQAPENMLQFIFDK